MQKSKVATPRIFREDKRWETIADSYTLNRVAEIAGEFDARRPVPPHLYTKDAPTARRIFDHLCKTTFATVSGQQPTSDRSAESGANDPKRFFKAPHSPTAEVLGSASHKAWSFEGGAYCATARVHRANGRECRTAVRCDGAGAGANVSAWRLVQRLAQCPSSCRNVQRTSAFGLQRGLPAGDGGERE